MYLILASITYAAPLRVAIYNASLERDGPGILLRAIETGTDTQIAAVIDTLTKADADIVVLTAFDWDYGGAALSAFQHALEENGQNYPFLFAPKGNAGRLWPDGSIVAFGKFSGSGGMALLSRYPLGQARSFQNFIWPETGKPLAAHGIWDVTVQPPFGDFHVLASHTTPPAFGLVEGRNRRRNDAEIAFWSRYLSGEALRDDAGQNKVFDAADFVLLAGLNNDPVAGDGLKTALRKLLDDPKLQNPAALIGVPTVYWQNIGELRADYALPSRGFQILSARVLQNDTASHHRLVLLELDR